MDYSTPWMEGQGSCGVRPGKLASKDPISSNFNLEPPTNTARTFANQFFPNILRLSSFAVRCWYPHRRQWPCYLFCSEHLARAKHRRWQPKVGALKIARPKRLLELLRVLGIGFFRLREGFPENLDTCCHQPANFDAVARSC